MIDYLQAGEIRRKYSEFLTRQNIDAIISEWDKNGIERVDMLYFSSIFVPKIYNKLNISELELALRAEFHFNFKELEPVGNSKFYGMLAVVYFENLTGYRDSYEVEKETYDLRLQIGEEFLSKCAELDKLALTKGFSTKRKIQREVNEKYKAEQHPWQKRLDKLVDKYI